MRPSKKSKSVIRKARTELRNIRTNILKDIPNAVEGGIAGAISGGILGTAVRNFAHPNSYTRSSAAKRAGMILGGALGVAAGSPYKGKLLPDAFGGGFTGHAYGSIFPRGFKVGIGPIPPKHTFRRNLTVFNAGLGATLKAGALRIINPAEYRAIPKKRKGLQAASHRLYGAALGANLGVAIPGLALIASMFRKNPGNKLSRLHGGISPFSGLPMGAKQFSRLQKYGGLVGAALGAALANPNRRRNRMLKKKRNKKSRAK